jgi:hypothetical protein
MLLEEHVEELALLFEAFRTELNLVIELTPVVGLRIGLR